MTTRDTPAIVVAGDALVDLTPATTADGAVAYVPHAGGSCLNVAVGLGRLGVPTAFLARISRDAFGALLRDQLAASDVEPDYLIQTDDLTTLAAVHLREGQASYSFHAAQAADRGLRPEHLTDLPAGAALHLGSIAMVLEPVATTLEGLLLRESGSRFISLDPNIRPGLIADRDAYLRRFATWVAAVDLLKVSEEDLAWLAPGRAPDDVITGWLTAGVALVLLTRGAAGASARTRGASAEVAAPPVAVVDTVGAGDAFTAGALAHLVDRGQLSRPAVAALDTAGLADLLTSACRIAADTCTRAGADPPRRSTRVPPMMKGMKAVRYAAPGDVAVTEVPVPPVGPHDVRIAVQLAGVCGTDVHLHHGTYLGVYPLVPGHEVVGRVEALGSEVSRFRIGEQVTVNPNIYCGTCSYCLAGRLGQCVNTEGMGVHRPGFFAEYAVADHRQVFSAEGIDPDTAVFIEPTACAMHGLETLAPRPGSTALVIGAGPTGLLLAQLIARGGAASVTVADIVAFKLSTASALGLDARVQLSADPDADLERLLAASPSGDGYDVVVEATGVTAVGDLCVPMTRNGGTVLIYGVTRPDERLSVSPFELFRREITIKGSYAEMTSFAAAIAALRTGRVRTDGIISHRFGLDDYAQALQTLTSDRTAHKVILDLT